MRFVHGVQVRVFVTREDVESEIITGLRWLFPLDLDANKIAISRQTVEGVEGNQIIILSAVLLKEAHTNLFLRIFCESLGPEQCALLLTQKESRLDESLHFFLRLDKKSVLQKKAVLTDSGDCFHLMLTIAAFPSNRASALLVVEKIFKQQP